MLQTQHSFWGSGFCNPALLLELRVLQPNALFRVRVLQPSTPFRVYGFATQHSFQGLGFCNPALLLEVKVLLSLHVRVASFILSCAKTKDANKKEGAKKMAPKNRPSHEFSGPRHVTRSCFWSYTSPSTSAAEQKMLKSQTWGSFWESQH